MDYENQIFESLINKNNQLIKDLINDLEKNREKIQNIEVTLKELKREIRELVPADVESRVCKLINENTRNNWFAIISGLVIACILYYIDQKFYN